MVLVLKDLNGMTKIVAKKMWHNWTEISCKDHGHKMKLVKNKKKEHKEGYERETGWVVG